MVRRSVLPFLFALVLSAASPAAARTSPWSLSGVVADGLADAVPLDALTYSGEATPLYDISLPNPKPQAATSEPPRS